MKTETPIQRWKDAREDRVLVRRLRMGDTVALERIYDKYRDDLLRIAACLLVDPSAAEDALHDAFVAFAEGAARMRAGRHLKRYLAVAVANRSRDALRRGMVRERLCPAPLDAVAEPASRSPAQPALLIEQETRAEVAEAIASLPLEQREVITLHLHGGLTFRQIAGEQETSVNTVMSRYRYGLARLRSLLKGESYHEVQ